MESWTAMKIELEDETIIWSVYIPLIVLCGFAELWCCYATRVVLKNPENRASIPLLLLFLSLHLTLLLRILSCIHTMIHCFKDYWALYIICLLVLAKDVTVISIVYRVYNGVAALNNAPIWGRLVTGTYIGLGVHACVYYVLIILEAVHILSKWDVIPYTVAVQGVIFAVFIYGNIVFFKEKKELEGDPLFVKWMTIVLIYMNVQLIFRTANNILVLAGVHGRLKGGDEVIYESIQSLLTEVIPCVLLSYFLYILADSSEEAEEEAVPLH